MLEIVKVRKTYKNMQIMRELDEICFPEDCLAPLGLRKYDWWYVYDENKNVVAYAVACKMNKCYFLARAGVVPEKRGQGIQETLIIKRIEMANKLKIQKVITYTSIENKFSIKNLIKCKFEEWKDAPNSFKREGFIPWIFNF